VSVQAQVARPMTSADIHESAALFVESIGAVVEQHRLPGDADPPASSVRSARLERRIAHMLGTDPRGAWVAVEGGRVVGLAQAVMRQGLWILSLLGVARDRQDRGIGRMLLEQAVGYGPLNAPGLIYSSPDPRAMRRYVRAGFALHPSAFAVGSVPRGSIPQEPAVRRGGTDDLDLVAGVDRLLRGAPHGPDVEYLLGTGVHLLVLDDVGYALVAPGTPGSAGSPGVPGSLVVLGATDEVAARALLRASLAELSLPEDPAPVGSRAAGSANVAVELRVEWLTAMQQWAFEECSDLGLVFRSSGAVMVRGRPGPLTPYVPSGAFG
jgi:GNAT superfamily N-acetyltransferase